MLYSPLTRLVPFQRSRRDGKHGWPRLDMRIRNLKLSACATSGASSNGTAGSVQTVMLEQCLETYEDLEGCLHLSEIRAKKEQVSQCSIHGSGGILKALFS